MAEPNNPKPPVPAPAGGAAQVRGSPSRRTLQYGGQPLVVCGPAGDAYFEGLDLAHAPHRPFLTVVDKVLRDDAVALDIGANIGLTAMMMARRTSAPIIAVEPSPTIFPFLQATIEANGAHNVTALRAAVGSAPGTVQLFENPTAGAASHLTTSDTMGARGGVAVEMRTLDDIVAQAGLLRVDLVKIDVEGFELDVLEGASETLARYQPGVFVEFNAFTLITFRNQNPREVLTRIRTLFPFVYRFVGGVPRLIRNQADEIAFLHDVLVGAGCVDDLFGSFVVLV